MSQSIIESKFKRFLLYGSEEIVYFPGSRLQYKYYLGTTLASLRDLLNNVEKHKIFDMIKYVQDEKLASHISIVPLVVSECCKISGWKDEALEFALSVLRTGEEFLLFCKFSYEILPDIGTGPLVTDFIGKWYGARHYLELVEMVSEKPSSYGWSHREVIRLGKVSSPSKLKEAAFAYAIGGTELMNILYENDDEARVVIQHLNRVEIFKFETDPDKAVIEIGAYMHKINSTNDVLLKNKQVWKALIRQMDLKDLFTKLPTIYKSGFLRCQVLHSWDPHFVPHLCDRLESLGAVLQSKLNPCRSCIEHQRWKHMSKRICRRAPSVVRNLKPKPVNKDVLQALNGQLEKAILKSVKKTSISITVIVDAHNLAESYCTYKRFVQADMAAAVAALYLAKSTSNAKLVLFKLTTTDKWTTHKYVKPVVTVDELVNDIGTGMSYCPSTREILSYLSPQNEEINGTDLFVVIGANIKFEDYYNAVELHRKENPRAPKFAFCTLGGIRVTSRYSYREEVILTSGFDDKMCDIITAFATT